MLLLTTHLLINIDVDSIPHLEQLELLRTHLQWGEKTLTSIPRSGWLDNMENPLRAV